MAPIQIAILDCDPLTPNICRKYGDYGGVEVKWVQEGAPDRGLSDQYQIRTWNVMGKGELPSVDKVDAVIITGSRVNAFEEIPWVQDLVDFIKSSLNWKRVKIAGLCFGHQVIARAMDAPVIKSSQGWEVSVCSVELSARGQKLFGRDRLNVHQMHKDMVVSYPEGVEALGSSPSCKVQGMFIPNRVLSLQGHPEFGEDIMLELLGARSDLGIHDDRIFEDALRRASNWHDGAHVAKERRRNSLKV